MRQKQEEARRRLILLLSCWALAAAVLCSESLVLPDNEAGLASISANHARASPSD